MKILLLTDSFNVGGAQRQFVALTKELNKYHEVEVIVFHPHTSHLEEEVKELKIPIYKILKKSRFEIKFIGKLIKEVKNRNYDISISYLDTPNFYNEILKIAGVVPKIIISQRSAYFKKTLTFKKKVLEYFHTFADVISTNSISQAERMKECFPFLSEKIVYTPNIYNIPKIPISSTKDKKVKFIVVSNTHYYKNPLKLCEAVLAYSQKYGEPKFKIDWFGRISSNEKDKLVMEKGLSLLEEKGLEKVLTFKGVTNEIYSKINMADALIHLSDFEGCPNSVCEAMFLKKPVLLSNVCDHPILVSNENGFLLDQKNPIDIAEKIHEFFQKEENEIKEMGERSYQLIKKQMSKEVTIQKWLNLIKN
ncbi:glycosyltransferase family 4 protein [Aureivirga sp. CE67]|uniref:glycosyltransferase family 4 protein n=1 Tax=Aureivirga sp. CE67 TaxID=1788983 RepID=UPI0018C9E124|nr:glycosyltransferase family 4 protein [Aureivirga sp. CE67]